MNAPIKVKEILFPEGEIKTDSLLYREKCTLLLPEPFSQNMFYAISDELQARFFIATDSPANMDRLQSFFVRLYGANFEDTSYRADEPAFSIGINFRTPFIGEKEFYHPGFVRNMLDFNSVDRGSTIRYTVSIRSGGKPLLMKRTYGLAITVSFDSENARNRLAPLISQEMLTFREEAGIRPKIVRSRVIRDTVFHRPFNLINFIRVPSEKDLVL